MNDLIEDAATIEQLQARVAQLHQAAKHWYMCRHSREICEHTESVLSETPPDYLAQVKREAVAEAFEEFLSDKRNWEYVAGGHWIRVIQRRIDELRAIPEKKGGTV